MDEGDPPGEPPAAHALRAAAGGCRELPDDPAASRRSSPTWSSATPRSGVEVVNPKSRAPALTNAEAAGCASGRGAPSAPRPPARPRAGAPPTTTSSTPDLASRRRTGRRARSSNLPRRRQLVEGYRFVREVVSRQRGRPVSEGGAAALHARARAARVCCTRAGSASSYAGEIDAPAPAPAAEGGRHHDFSHRAPNEAWVSDVTEFRLPDDGRKGVPVARRRPVRRQARRLGRNRHQPRRAPAESSSDGVRDARGRRRPSRTPTAAATTAGPGGRPYARAPRSWPGRCRARSTSPDNAACEGSSAT